MFYEEGIHATGVDRGGGGGGGGEDDAVQALSVQGGVGAGGGRGTRTCCGGGVSGAVRGTGGSSSTDQILGAFDLLDSRLHEAEFRGCPFVRAAAEYSALEAPVHQIAAGFKRFTCDLFEELAVAAEMSEPKELAMELTLLFEGAIVTSFVMGDQSLAANARRAAAALVDARLAEGRSVEAPQVGRGS